MGLTQKSAKRSEKPSFQVRCETKKKLGFCIGNVISL